MKLFQKLSKFIQRLVSDMKSECRLLKGPLRLPILYHYFENIFKKIDYSAKLRTSKTETLLRSELFV